MSLLIERPFVEGRPLSLFIEEGVITAVGKERPADRTIHAEGLHAFPSLRNSHTHAAMTLFRGFGDDMPLLEWLEKRIWPAEALLTEEDVYHGTRLALLEMIRGGTTFLSDMYWHRPAVARAVEEMGVTGTIASVFIDLGDGEKAAAQRERTSELIARRDEYGPRVRLALGPHAVYTVSVKSLEWIAEQSETYDLPVHVHLSETKTEVEECQKAHGCRPPELMRRVGLVGPRLVGAHGVWLNDAEREMLAGAGATIVTNPTSNLKLAVGRIFDFAAAKRAGLRVVLGTDGAASNNNLDMVEEMKFAALLAKHASGDPTCLPAREALELATTAPAATFGLGSGRIETGAPADIMLLDFSTPATTPVHDPVSNLVYAGSAGNVVTTISAGKVLMADRKVEVADEREILESAARAAESLVRRATGG